MTEFIRGLFRAKHAPEFEAKLKVTCAEIARKSAYKFLTEGPDVPNWNLAMQITLDQVRFVWGSMRASELPMNEQNFDLDTVVKKLAVIRNIEADITHRGGDHRHLYWSVDAEKLLVSPHEVFDKLAEQDRELVKKSTPRQLFAEVVACDKVIKEAQGKGIDVDTTLGFKPLHDGEVVMIHFHGGAYCYESAEVYRGSSVDISKETGNRVFVPDYRFAPEHPFPTSIYDGYLFYQFLLTQGFKPENIIIMGDSAGGNLCLCLMLILKWNSNPQPKAAILFSPWCDLTFSTNAWHGSKINDFIAPPKTDSVLNITRLYVSPGRPYDDELNELLHHPLVSPLYGDLEGLAPMYIHGGEEEKLIDDIDNLAKKVGAKEVFIKGRDHPGIIHAGDRNIYEKYAGMVHVFFMFEDADEKHAAIKGVGNFVRSLN
ncbi:hypothetical protein BB559_001413 [Furculomyces boomerangus]|uniref:Alpha/beta hydrolase fold-3 domain-containing protein n=1 Tax=Furculomyces boomerangus TaxID=61424 RepID=A0A2T9Z1Z9_9FUNG|nr:hypothetical protein BB559_001413 [Furculomyces boomerangus]